MKQYETVIVGSGYFALGYAATHENTLILEETQMVDRHFGACLRGFDLPRELPRNGGAARLYAHFCELGLVRDGRLSVTGLEAAICDFLDGDYSHLLVGTACVAIDREDGGYVLSTCNNEGLGKLFAKRVIDTRVSGGKWLNVLIEETEGGRVDADNGSPAFFEGQRVLALHLPTAPDINRAKAMAYPILERLLSPVGARILGMSYQMYDDTAEAPKVGQGGVIRVDENYYGDPFTAYAKGENFHAETFMA